MKIFLYLELFAKCILQDAYCETSFSPQAKFLFRESRYKKYENNLNLQAQAIKTSWQNLQPQHQHQNLAINYLRI
jgi:hypothetical protein